MLYNALGIPHLAKDLHDLFSEKMQINSEHSVKIPNTFPESQHP